MRIRPYSPADFDALKQMHAAQGFGYPFPDLDSPLFVAKLVLEEGDRGAGGDVEATRREVTGREEAHLNSPVTGPRDVSPQPGHCHGAAARPRIVMAVLLRLTAEAYLLHDATAGTPRERWRNLLALHEAVRTDAAGRGLDDVQAFLPPRVARAFGRRLARLGWRQDPWTCFTRVI